MSDKSGPVYPGNNPVYQMDIYGDSSKYKTDASGHPIVSHYEQSGGLTKREWFAGMALQGFLAKGDRWVNQRSIAEAAYHYADAMLTESEKP